MNKKLLTTSIVILFLGLAFAPSIHANISKESELVEITTEVCGLPGQKPQTVQLSKSDAEAVYRLFKEIKLKLDAVESRKEAVEVFNEAIMELDKYALLGELSVEKTQNLVLGRYQNSREIQFLEKRYPWIMEKSEDIDNFLCLIAGRTTYTFFQTWLSAAILMSTIPLTLLFVFFYLLLRISLFPIISSIILNFIANFGSYLGRLVDATLTHQPLMFGVNIWLSQSNGWVRTIGLKGIQKIDGYFNGKMLSQGILDEYFKAWIYGYTDPNESTKAAKRFIGLRINLDSESYESFYIGTALAVRLGPGN